LGVLLETMSWNVRLLWGNTPVNYAPPVVQAPMRPECGRQEYCSDIHAETAVTRKEVAASASQDCSRNDAGLENLAVVAPLRQLHYEDPVTQAVGARFLQSWVSLVGQMPILRSMYQISVPSTIVKRFEQSVDRAEALAGSAIRAAFFGGQCICNLGATSDPRDKQTCNWSSCSICMAIKTGFDKVEFGGDMYGGSPEGR